MAALVVLVAAVVAAGAWYYLAGRARGTPPAAAVSAATTSAPLAESPPVATTLPPLEQMDPYARDLLATLGTSPLLLKWLATDDLVGAIATAIDKLAQRQSPARDLAVLRPTEGFAVARRNGVVLVAPATYARYGPLVDTVAAIDSARLAAAFTTLKPRIAEAYRRQGHPDGGFDPALARAIAIVVATPDVPADAALVPGIGGYAYANPAFEQLPPAQKQLIRMGPEHAARVRDAARRFAAALAATPTTAR
ncbi:MAG: DUF3014 domain-containing protein [Acidobacteriota bacterium]